MDMMTEQHSAKMPHTMPVCHRHSRCPSRRHWPPGDAGDCPTRHQDSHDGVRCMIQTDRLPLNTPPLILLPMSRPAWQR